jgi:hypothetical protein
MNTQTVNSSSSPTDMIALREAIERLLPLANERQLWHLYYFIRNLVK